MEFEIAYLLDFLKKSYSKFFEFTGMQSHIPFEISELITLSTIVRITTEGTIIQQVMYVTSTNPTSF